MRTEGSTDAFGQFAQKTKRIIKASNKREPFIVMKI